MPASTPEKQALPSGSDLYALLADLRRLAESTRSVVPVTSISDRDTVVARMTDAGRPVSASNPLIVLRADAPAGRAIEFTTNGTTWMSLAPGPSEWVRIPDAPANTSGLASNDTARDPWRARRVGEMVETTGTVMWKATVGNLAMTATGAYLLSDALPAEVRPAPSARAQWAGFIQATTGSMACMIMYDAATYRLSVRPAAAVTMVSQSSAYYIVIPPTSWRAA